MLSRVLSMIAATSTLAACASHPPGTDPQSAPAQPAMIAEHTEAAPDQPAPRDRDYPWMTLHTWWQKHEALVNIDSDKRRKATLVFLGDSITEGWDDALWNERYAKHHAVRLGLGGDKTQQVLWRIDHDELEGLHPKVLVLLIGTNNFGLGEATPAGVASGVRKIVKRLHEHLATTKILLVAILPRDEHPDSPARKQIADTNALLQKLDDGSTVRYLDIGSRFLAPDGTIPKDVMEDFLHPTVKGYRIFADAIQPLLDTMLR